VKMAHCQAASGPERRTNGCRDRSLICISLSPPSSPPRLFTTGLIAAIIILSSTILALAITLAGCGGGGGGGGAVTGVMGANSAGGGLSGVLLDANGAPIADALVVVHSTARSTLTSADGSWTINGIDPGTHVLEILAPACRRLEVPVVVGSGATTVPSSQTIPAPDADQGDNPTLTVLYPTSPAGITGGSGTVHVQAGGGAGGALRLNGYCTAVAGSLDFNDNGSGADRAAGDGIYSASYTITADWPEGISHWNLVAVDNAGNRSAPAKLAIRALVQAGRVQGTVSGNSQPLPGARVKAATLDGSVVIDTLTGADGSYGLWLPVDVTMELSYNREGYYGILYARGSVAGGEVKTISPALVVKSLGNLPPFPILDW